MKQQTLTLTHADTHTHAPHTIARVESARDEELADVCEPLHRSRTRENERCGEKENASISF